MLKNWETLIWPGAYDHNMKRNYCAVNLLPELIKYKSLFFCVCVCVWGGVRWRKDRPAPHRRSAAPCLGVQARSSSAPRRCRSARRHGRLWEEKELWPDLRSKVRRRRRMKTREKQGQYEKCWLSYSFSPLIVKLFKLRLLELIQPHNGRDTQTFSASV